MVGNAFVLELGCNGKVVDFEGSTIVEQHGSAQNEASYFSIYVTFQTIMLLAFKQLVRLLTLP